MASVNKVILVGYLGADPEIRSFGSGSKVANFNVATSESYTNKSGEKVDNTEWHRLECWEGLAENAEKYLKKGSLIYIEGKIRTEEWDDKDGNKRYTTKIRVQNMTFLGSPNDAQNGNSQKTTKKPKDATWMPQSSGTPISQQPDSEEDDLPF